MRCRPAPSAEPTTTVPESVTASESGWRTVGMSARWIPTPSPRSYAWTVFVPVEGEPNTFARREVVVGRPVNGYVPVVSGLKDGESLVVSGTVNMRIIG